MGCTSGWGEGVGVDRRGQRVCLLVIDSVSGFLAGFQLDHWSMSDTGCPTKSRCFGSLYVLCSMTQPQTGHSVKIHARQHSFLTELATGDTMQHPTQQQLP